MLEEMPKVNEEQIAPPVGSSQAGEGYNPEGGLTYKEYLEQGGEYGQQARGVVSSDTFAEQPQSQTEQLAPNAPTQSVEVKDADLRPVKDGELTELLQKNPEILDPESDDELKLGAAASMAMEPWTLDLDNSESSKDTPEEEITEPPVETPPTDPPVETPPEEPPVETPPEEPPVETPPEEPPVETPPEEPPVETPPEEPELVKTPELLEAERLVDIARDELARLKAGRESATFFSIKFSKKKLEAAEQAYQEAVGRAGSLAVNLLIDRGHTIEDIRSAVNFGSFVEASKLFRRQAQYETQAIEGKRFKKFYEWWNKQGTKLLSVGTLKKGAVMAAIGAPIGIAVGIVGAPILGGAGLAAGAGLAVARSVSRGLVGNTIRKNSEAIDMPTAKAEAREQEVKAIIDALEAQQSVIRDSAIYELESSHTSETKHGNDRRALTSMAVSAGSAALGYLLIDHFLGGTPNIPKPPEPGSGPYHNLDDYNPEIDWFIGMHRSNPGGTDNLFRIIEDSKGAIKPDPNSALAKLVNNWNVMKGKVHISTGEAQTMHEVVGKLGSVPGIGHEWSKDHLNTILGLVRKNGLGPVSADKIAEIIKSSHSQ